MAKPLPAERAYETLFVCPSDTPQKTIDLFIEKIKTAIAPTKGVLRSVQVWGRRKLTYPIKHQKDGLYIFIDYTGAPGTTQALHQLFHVTDHVIRHVTTDKMNLRPPYVRKMPTTSEPTAEGAAATATATATAAAPSVETKANPS